MVLYKDGKFHVKGISFCLPDGYYLNTDSEISQKFRLEALPQDQSFTMRWLLTEISTKDSYAVLEYLFTEDVGFKPIVPVSPISVNGLTGHQCVGVGKYQQFYEVQLDLDDGALFGFSIYTRNQYSDIINIIERQDVIWALNQIYKNK